MNDLVKSIISNVIGRKIKKADAGYGSMIDFKFENAPNESGDLWGIWLQHVVWRLEKDNKVYLTSEFEKREDFILLMEKMNGSKLSEIEFDGPYNDSKFIFDNGYCLKTFCTYSENRDLASWDLFGPEGHVLSMGPGSKVEIPLKD